jgi:16S rRNA (guanine527-N7)-methyltransferase
MSIPQRLHAGLVELGLQADERQLLRYLGLLEKWNRTYNLTAVREPEQMVAHHVLDSLSIVPFVAGARTLLDVGSGAGLPGIPLAVALPELAVTLLDSSHKKAAFLRQAQLELDLGNLSVAQERVEAWRPEQPFDVIVSRAFGELGEFIKLAGHLCSAGGKIMAMKGLYPHEELARIPEGFKLEQVAELNVPELPAHRHLVVAVKAA